MQDLLTGGSLRSANCCNDISGFSSRSRAAWRSFSGIWASRPLLSSRRIPAICSRAASTVLLTLAMSQFMARLAPLRISLSTLAVMMSMAATGAPMVVSRSSICSDCLK